jgi:hypothetical protein
MAIKTLKRHKLTSINQIPGEIIKVGARTIVSNIYKRINSNVPYSLH